MCRRHRRRGDGQVRRRGSPTGGRPQAAEAQLADGKYPPAVERADKTAEEQAAEITRMKGPLASL